MVRRSTMLRKDGSEVAVEKTLHSATTGRDGSQSVITLARDITARLAAEAELRQNQDALRDAEQVLAVAEDRERIARDLHDTVIQRLFAEGLGLQAALGGVGDPQRTRARLESTIDGLDETIRELRTAVFSLQGSASAPGGLRGRLLQVVTDATDGLGFEPRLQFDGPIETIDDHIAEHLTPVLREALSNIAHHAHARDVRVAIRVDDDVTLTVADDGDRRTRPGARRPRPHQPGRPGPCPQRRLHHRPPTRRRFAAHLAGTGRRVSTAGMTAGDGPPVRCVLLT